MPGEIKLLKIQRFKYIEWNSCAAVLTQMIAYYFGYLLYPKEAINLVNSYPDGATIKECLVKLSKKFKIRHKWLSTIKRIENWIDKGLPVASSDDNRYNGPHCVLIIGYDDDDFYVADPNRLEIQKMDKIKLFENSDEVYGVWRK